MSINFKQTNQATYNWPFFFSLPLPQRHQVNGRSRAKEGEELNRVAWSGFRLGRGKESR